MKEMTSDTWVQVELFWPRCPYLSLWSVAWLADGQSPKWSTWKVGRRVVQEPCFGAGCMEASVHGENERERERERGQLLLPKVESSLLSGLSLSLSLSLSLAHSLTYALPSLRPFPLHSSLSTWPFIGIFHSLSHTSHTVHGTGHRAQRTRWRVHSARCQV